MGVRILTDNENSCLYDSVTEWAFGPVFREDEDPEQFLEWLKEDPRHLTDTDLANKYYQWRQSLSIPEQDDTEELEASLDDELKDVFV